MQQKQIYKKKKNYKFVKLGYIVNSFTLYY